LDFLTDQRTSTFLGMHCLPSSILWIMSLKIAKNGDIPMPPATKMRFSYLNTYQAQVMNLKFILWHQLVAREYSDQVKTHIRW